MISRYVRIFFKFTLFADDSTLTCCFDHSNLNIIKTELESHLLPVFQWLNINRIKVNSNKSNFMIFSYRKTLVIDSLNFGGYSLMQVHTTKFLGIQIDEHLTFVNHTDHILTKISRTIGLLFKLNKLLPQNVLLCIYNTHGILYIYRHTIYIIHGILYIYSMYIITATLLLPYFNYGIKICHGSPNFARTES